MKSIIYFTTLATLVSAVSAGAIFKAASECPPVTSTYPDGVYLSPSANPTIPRNTRFNITFCSGRYFKTSTRIFQAFLREDPSSELYPFYNYATNDAFTVDDLNFPTALPGIDYQPDRNYSIIFLEGHTNYGASPPSTTVTTIPIKVV